MTQSQPPAAADLTGQVLGGKYRVRRMLGKGGFGTVYEGVDEMLGALVAIKVLNSSGSDDHAIAQFLEEAKILTTLDHQNIVRWITFDKTKSGLHYFVMEHLQGEELSDLLFRENKLEPERVVDILTQVLSALVAAHNLPDGSSLLHLDLKPQNVFVVKGPSDRIKVIDFGISQLVGSQAAAAPRKSGGKVDVMRTMATMVVSSDADGDEMGTLPIRRPTGTGEDDDDEAGTIPVAASKAETSTVQRAKGGTPVYASPEQCKHLTIEHGIVDLDERSDLYSLGIMAFQMLTGELPYGMPTTAQECFQAHFEKQPAKPSDHGVKVPRRLSAFIDRCLEKDREKRYASSEEALEALESVYRKSAKWPKVVAALLFVAVVGLVYFWPEPTRFLVDAGVNDEVLLGPEKQTLSIPMRDVEIGGTTATARLVRDPAGDDQVLADWKTTVRDEGGSLYLDLTAPPGLKDLVEETVHVHVEGADPAYSEELRILYLGANAWGVRDVYVEGFDEQWKVLDPRGASLLIHVMGRSDFFDENGVQVTLAGSEPPEKSGAKRSAKSPPDGEGLVYEVPFASFPSLGGAVQGFRVFEVVVTDRSGRASDPEKQKIAIDSRKLEITAELTGCNSTGDKQYQMSKASAPILDVTANREIDDAWQIHAVKLDGSPLTIGHKELSTGWPLEFPPPGSEGRYTATVTITAKDTGILHPGGGPEEATDKFTVVYNTAELTVGMKLDGQKWEDKDAERTHFTHEDHLKLFLDRGPAVRSVFKLEVGEGQPIDLGVNDTVNLHDAENKEIELPLRSDGKYRIAIAAHRLIDAKVPAEQAEWQKTITVVRDTKPPVGTFALSADLVLDKAGKTEWAPVLEIRDEGPARAKLDWTLSGPGKLEDKGGCDGRGKLGLEAFGLDASKLADGVYTLTLRGTDAAGNVVLWSGADKTERKEEMVCIWQVARAGPELSYKRPPEKWKPRSGNTFRIVLGARDPNGVKGAHCEIRIEGEDGKLGPVPLTREVGADGKVADQKELDWTGEVDLPAGFSGKNVTLAFSAEDAFGNSTEREESEVPVVKFDVSRLETVRVRPKGITDGPVTKMIYLEGIESYSFMGRSEVEERKTFAEYMEKELPPKYGEKTSAKAQPVKDFYLDETEVTVAQFLAFVRDSGYTDAKHWREAPEKSVRRPSADLIAALEKTYGTGVANLAKSELPIVAVDYYEAAAFASWAGKRLPKAVELEYAIRGGVEYRPFSFAKRGEKVAPKVESFNVRKSDPKDVRQLWTVRKGVDKTPEGIYDLCSNVGEWAGPLEKNVKFGWMEARSVGAKFSDVSMSDGKIAFSFTKSAAVRPRERRLNLGFRCAVDASRMDKVCDGDDDGLRLEQSKERK